MSELVDDSFVPDHIDAAPIDMSKVANIAPH
jgi:hypothetical protein